MTNTLELFIEKQTILSNQVVASMLGWMGVCGVGGLLTPGNTPFAEPNPKKLVEKTIFEKNSDQNTSTVHWKTHDFAQPYSCLKGANKIEQHTSVFEPNPKRFFEKANFEKTSTKRLALFTQKQVVLSAPMGALGKASKSKFS